ncbi:LOW QUALITY PROTEIN: hypothetical protein TorRG33x02_265750 [Trema orientale]|uniref:Uncharacterized protein n=1 Tax=Trema orientale TaxID=63057 RepID=A0A2P5D1Q3_TREOI|nr:LOW QUALITY PROTEIN: hypothetical protein TorRG33x02_265750 [Trema orientale]
MVGKWEGRCGDTAFCRETVGFGIQLANGHASNLSCTDCIYIHISHYSTLLFNLSFFLSFFLSTFCLFLKKMIVIERTERLFHSLLFSFSAI